MVELTSEKLKNIFTREQRHANYKQCVEMAGKLTVHADGLYPGSLIDERRPSESPETRAYRKKIYKPITEGVVSKVISSLGKIRRSPDWIIQYDKEKVPPTITADNTLGAYCERWYPLFTSVTNWVFSELLRRYLLDANAVVAVVPKGLPEGATEYLQPVAMLFGSGQVLDYEADSYAVLLSSETVRYNSPGGRNVYNDGKVFYVLTTEFVARYEQQSRSQDFTVAWSYRHDFGTLPVFKVGGLLFENKHNDIIFKSRIAGILPHLDEAVREYSDLQAEIVQHIHSEKYVYVYADCPECKGIGTLLKDNGQQSCPKCHGVGSVRSVSPYGVHEIAPAKVGESAIPSPPIGYIQKQTEIARLQDERVDKHLYKALSAINMEFLMETPLNQSGVAKEVDKDELNNLVSAIAEDLVAVMDKVYFYINEYRYSVILPNRGAREAMLPVIPVPERFDLLNSTHIMAELTAAKTSGVSSVLLRAMEIDYAKKRFNANPEVSYFLQAVYDLDPLAGLDEDEKMSRLSNGGITELSYVISSNINAFVQRAVKEHADFYTQDFEQQQAIILAYAQEVQTENSAAQQVQQALQGAAGSTPDDEQATGGDDLHKKVRTDYAAGMRQIDIADKYRISQQTVSKIINS
jgi:hypothetical protein